MLHLRNLGASSSSSSTQGFTNVTVKNTHSIKNSSIYVFANRLAQENNELVKPFDLLNHLNRIDRKERHTVFLKFKPEQVVANLYSERGFKCTSRHLALDKTYSLSTSEKGQMGFAAAHYSEKYSHPVSGARISVHVYFSDQAPYIQLRESENNEAAFKEVTEILPVYFKNKILSNAYEAESLFKRLCLKRDSEWLELLTKLELMQEKLDAASNGFKNAEEEQVFYRLADEFVEGIKLLNSLNEFDIDSRDRRIIERVKYLKSIANEQVQEAAVAQPPKPELEVTQAEKSSPSLAVIKTAVCNQANVIRDNTLQQLAKMEKILGKALDKSDLAELIKIASEIRPVLVECYFFKKLNNDQKALIKKLEGLVQQYKCTTDFVLRQFTEGKIEHFIVAYSSLTRQQQSQVIAAMHLGLVFSEAGGVDLSDQKIKICDYLYENSPVYKAMLKVQDSMLYTSSDDNLLLSQLVYFCIKGMSKTFEMFLRHGANPNWVGCQKNGVVLSMLRAVVLFNDKPYEYVNALLNSGALIDVSPAVLNETNVRSRGSQNKALSNKGFIKQYFGSTQRQGGMTDLLSEYARSPSDLNVANFSGQYDCAELFIEKSSLANLSFVFAKVTGANYLITRHITNREMGFDFFASKVEADAAVPGYNIFGPRSLRVAYFPNPNQPKDNTQNKIDFAQLLILAMQRKVKHSPANVEEILDKMEKAAEGEKDLLNKASSYLGCITIILLRGVPDDVWSQKLVKFMKRLANVYTDLESPQLASAYCTLADFFAEAPQLSNTNNAPKAKAKIK